jgi:hypothetical protein
MTARLVKTIFLSAAFLAPAFATHGILLVSDQVDGVRNPQLFDSYYENAVRDAGYTYVRWDHFARGEPTFQDLRDYKVVIWYTSTSGDAPASDPLRGEITLTPAEQSTLVKFLTQTPGTTTVMLSGMYMAWNCVADAAHERQLYKPLFSDKLRLNYPHDNFDNWIKVEDDWKLGGESSCPIFKGETYTVNWRHHANWPDQLEPASGGLASAWWQDKENKKHHRAVIRASGAKANGGKYQLVLFACPFENIFHDTDRAVVMENFLKWAGTSQNPVEPASLGRVKALFH